MKAAASVVAPPDGALRQELFPKAPARSDSEPAPGPRVPPESSELEPTIYRFILKHSLRPQIMLLLLTLASFPFLYYSLDLPKTIVNRAIGGKTFPQQFFGYELDQIPYLMLL